MKPELQEKLVDYLGTLEEAVKTGSDFVAEQAPLVVQEYLQWCFWEAVVWAILCGVAIVIVWIPLVVLWRVTSKWELPDVGRNGKFGRDDRMIVTWIWSFISVVFCGFAMFGVYSGTLTALQITIAPRVFLLERIAELVK